MALTLNGSNNTITGLAVGGLPDGIVDTDMIAANAVTLAKSTGRKVLQVLNSQFSATINSTSYQSITGSSISITPSSTDSDVLVIVESAGTMVTGSSNGLFQITRAGTEIHDGSAYANPGGIRALMPMYSVYLDTGISTTSATSYAVNFKKFDGGGLGTADFGAHGSITLIELP